MGFSILKQELAWSHIVHLMNHGTSRPTQLIPKRSRAKERRRAEGAANQRWMPQYIQFGSSSREKENQRSVPTTSAHRHSNPGILQFPTWNFDNQIWASWSAWWRQWLIFRQKSMTYPPTSRIIIRFFGSFSPLDSHMMNGPFRGDIIAFSIETEERQSGVMTWIIYSRKNTYGKRKNYYINLPLSTFYRNG